MAYFTKESIDKDYLRISSKCFERVIPVLTSFLKKLNFIEAFIEIRNVLDFNSRLTR